MKEQLLQLEPIFCQADENHWTPPMAAIDDVLRTGKSQVVTCPGGQPFTISRIETPRGQSDPRYQVQFSCPGTCKAP